MKITIETINLKKAKEYLEHNIPFSFVSATRTNRPATIHKVKAYARDMLLDRWLLHNQGIGFDINDTLVDGQKRLMALVMAAEVGVDDLPPNPHITFTTQVTRGLDPSVFEVIDTGENRNSYQILSMNGIRNGMVVSAACRLLYAFDNTTDVQQWGRIRLTNHEVLQILEKEPVEDYVGEGSSLRPIGMIASVGTVALLVCERALPNGMSGKTISSFVKSLHTGQAGNNQSLKGDDPRFTLREYYLRSRSAKRHSLPRSQANQLFAFIKCWNDYILGRRRSLVAWRPSEGIIRPVGESE
jgi:hypothetical protein